MFDILSINVTVSTIYDSDLNENLVGAVCAKPKNTQRKFMLFLDHNKLVGHTGSKVESFRLVDTRVRATL